MKERAVDLDNLRLVWPAPEFLAGYSAALARGWSPDNLRPEAAAEELEEIARDPARFLAEQVDPEGKGPPLMLPDGRQVQRLPGYHKWIWDGEFCGTVGFRWQPGTPELPSYCLGHVGYSVVPWKRGRGYATKALRMLLPETRRDGLPFVELTTDEDNVPSRKVIEANGGVVFEHFLKPAGYGGAPSVRYRIPV